MSKVFDMPSTAKIARKKLALSQKGASLIFVMIILVVVSLLGIAGIQISMMSERGARNDRDMQIAWQAAEAALVDAEIDVFGPGTSNRRINFSPSTNVAAFITGCGTSGNSMGLCSYTGSGKPAWLTVNFETTVSAPTTPFGEFTGRTFPFGAGVQPSKRPRYVIEPIRDPSDRDASSTDPKYVYRITAMGFGPRDDIQAVIQTIYRN
jgi:type IV pilus assembly protein PilX